MANTDRFGSVADPGPKITPGCLTDTPHEASASFGARVHQVRCESTPGEVLPVFAGSQVSRRAKIETPDLGFTLGQRDDDWLFGSVPNNYPSTCAPARGDFLPDTIVTNSTQSALRRPPDCGALSTERDLIALKLVEAELRQKVKEQNAALLRAVKARQVALNEAQAREHFFANMSHELRTPLNAILGFSEVLKEEMFGPLANERYREYIEIIHKSGSHLLNLINDVLDMAKLGAGKLEMHFESVELAEVVHDCVRVVEQQANQSRIRICIAPCDGIGRLEADDKRLRQMLLNLLSNAVKFTRDGGEIRVSAVRYQGSIAISVSDTGVGIKPDDIPRILEPYEQIDSEIGRKHDGTGLGLPLVKELARLHGGTLAIESKVGVGTTATITLPCARASRARPAH